MEGVSKSSDDIISELFSSIEKRETRLFSSDSDNETSESNSHASRKKKRKKTSADESGLIRSHLERARIRQIGDDKVNSSAGGLSGTEPSCTASTENSRNSSARNSAAINPEFKDIHESFDEQPTASFGEFGKKTIVIKNLKLSRLCREQTEATEGCMKEKSDGGDMSPEAKSPPRLNYNNFGLLQRNIDGNNGNDKERSKSRSSKDSPKRLSRSSSSDRWSRSRSRSIENAYFKKRKPSKSKEYRKRRSPSRDRWKKRSRSRSRRSRSRSTKKRRYRSRSRSISRDYKKRRPYRRSRSFDRRRRSRSPYRKKRSRSRRRSRSRTRRRSRDRRRSRSRGWKRSRSRGRGKKSWSRDRSQSRDRSRSTSKETTKKSRSKSRSKSKEKISTKRSESSEKQVQEKTSESKEEIDKKKLLEIARRNAIDMAQKGLLPVSVDKEKLVTVTAGGKSVAELTDFCRNLAARSEAGGNESDGESKSASEDSSNVINHPFAVKPKVVMASIGPSPAIEPFVPKLPAIKAQERSKLRQEFPVSSGKHHRVKGSEPRVPLDKDSLDETEEENSVFPVVKAPTKDIGEIVSERMQAIQKLKENPHDQEAIMKMVNAHKEMQNWAGSKIVPGQFTGSVETRLLTPMELQSGLQAWVKKDQFAKASQVSGRGMQMLQKMGWKPGEGLGKNKEGSIEPLVLEVKTDKKGLSATEEHLPKINTATLNKDLSGKHPVSALMELCAKRRWGPPVFEMMADAGPSHNKEFVMKVIVNGVEYRPVNGAANKKQAKFHSATVALQALGLVPRDLDNPL